jgi:mannose-6-phosphate isomerase-like protein (cupin superfamily)
MPLTAKSLDQPDDTTRFPNGRVDVATIGDTTLSRAELQPGWRWSNDVKLVAGTETCQVHHTGYVLAGRLRVEHTDGASMDLRAGDAYDIGPGHDGWVVGDEPVLMLDWSAR